MTDQPPTPRAARPKRQQAARRQTARPETPRVVDYPGKPVVPPVRPHRPRARHRAALVSFVLVVVLPTLATVGYLYLRAADQYASTVAFSVRSSDNMVPSGILGAIVQNVSSAGADAEIVYEFVRSQKMVEAATAALPLVEMYNRPERDVFFRLGADRPLEDLVGYWNWMTDISFDSSTGIVRFEARAFTPEDAEAIAQFVLAESTRIVNELSEQARTDAIRVSQTVVAEAEARLREARRAMREFRDVEQEINPTANAQATLGLVAALEQELANARVALDSELELVGPQSPRLEILRQRIASLQKQIAEERSRLGAGALDPELRERRLASVISEYEERQVDLEFAQNAYVSALTAYEQAQIEAQRQSRFLAPHVSPTRSIEPQYPQRLMLSLATAGLLVVLWSVLLLVAYNVKERR